MSLSSAFNSENLTRLAKLEASDFAVFASAITLGYNPASFHAALQSWDVGSDPPLPKAAGQPKPLTVNAWSFVNDKAQFYGVYGLSSIEAVELKELLLSQREEAIKRIEAVVSGHLQRKGSNKSVHVTLDGMPGDRSGPGAAETSSLARELKHEINSNGSRYGRYKFEANASPLAGPHAFTVPLGGGFCAFFANKRGAVDVARIARVRGRNYPLIAGYIGFKHPSTGAFVFGDSIPAKCAWDCVQGPDEPLPPSPTGKEPTVVS
nr:PAS-rich protein [Cladosporium ramotenellum polymycovirus 1]WEW73481.1 PAS-rich protein [Cladosporium ramotenellum polymycovirus 1]